ncbi:hypothetical protein BLL42_27835 (plasmid) [Pseudomonas frederiksbergensis]|uniref:Uncharacterized protein n=1 Tax=Pseudomonas frederiksbergensis TaxID=104087 RepID=A0A1J0EUG0_9PSED|nr:hypothetical protein BLL42_27835 [Pseudomonas frederiksbergensis]
MSSINGLALDKYSSSNRVSSLNMPAQGTKCKIRLSIQMLAIVIAQIAFSHRRFEQKKSWNRHIISSMKIPKNQL